MLLYLFSYIDRANIGMYPIFKAMAVLVILSADLSQLGNAKIEGLLPDLGMSGTQYNIALAIFFIPYVLFGM